jgi:transcriptional regulator with XRE-family HTH domain
MISKETKIFLIDGAERQFDFSAFKISYDDYCKRNHINKCELEEEIAKELNVSSSAVHNWRSRSNGPSELTMIKDLSKILQTDYNLLLKEVKKENLKMTYTSIQIESIKKVYDAIIVFLENFLHTDGFNDLWFKYAKDEIEKSLIEDELNNYALQQINSVNCVLNQEYFYLHDLSIYEELEKYINDDLVNTFD